MGSEVSSFEDRPQNTEAIDDAGSGRALSHHLARESFNLDCKSRSVCGPVVQPGMLALARPKNVRFARRSGPVDRKVAGSNPARSTKFQFDLRFGDGRLLEVQTSYVQGR